MVRAQFTGTPRPALGVGADATGTEIQPKGAGMDAGRIELMRGMPIFGGLDEATLAWILERTPERTVPAESFFFRAGDRAESLFVLEYGHVTVFQDGTDGPLQLVELGPGDCFGEMALIDFGPRSASVRAVDDCVALEIPQTEIHALYEHDAKQFTLVQMNLARELCRRLRRADALVHQEGTRKGHRFST
jgi:CRP-like cAMP-binding protein